MADNQTVNSILQLEEHVNLLISRYKALKEDYEKLQATYSDLQQQHDCAKEQLLHAEQKLELLALSKESSVGNEAVKKYLDEVIKMLDQNIKLLK